MTDKELFQKLVEKNVISRELADSLLKEAEFSHTSPEEALYRKRAAREEAVAEVKAELIGAPYKKIDASAIPDEVLALIPKETSQSYRVAPLERQSGMLVVGMLRPDDPRAQEALRFVARREGVSLGVYIVTPSDLEAVWRRYVPFRSEIDQAVKEMGIRPEAEAQKIISLEAGAKSAEEAPVIKIVASALKRAVEVKASDIHFEPQRKRLRVRFRIDGELQEVASMPAELIQPVISRVKVLADLKLDENRIPQDGRFRTIVNEKEIDFRVATFPTPNGEKVVLRVLDSSTGLLGLEKLGLQGRNLEVAKAGLERPYGMILITGPTGSGKTTTLYSMMKDLNTEEVNVVSLEDPVEYFMEGVNQSQVKPEIGYTFASGLRQILRQDPDIVMVGEIRDSETAGLAVNAALTGHLVLSTLHTNNALGVIPRLIDLGAPAFLLSSALNLMLAQRLVGQLCPNCKKEAKAPEEVEKEITKALRELPESMKKEISKFSPPYTIYRPEPKESCETCKGKGTSGRVGLFEVLHMSREFGDLINSGFTEGKLWDEAKRQGIITLRQDGILKALRGEVAMEEVLKETAD
ncbi:MAG: ATPase, T2SS/T4P/T4SS family [Patescibacteria group bacterium]